MSVSKLRWCVVLFWAVMLHSVQENIMVRYEILSALRSWFVCRHEILSGPPSVRPCLESKVMRLLERCPDLLLVIRLWFLVKRQVALVCSEVLV